MVNGQVCVVWDLYPAPHHLGLCRVYRLATRVHVRLQQGVSYGRTKNICHEKGKESDSLRWCKRPLPSNKGVEIGDSSEEYLSTTKGEEMRVPYWTPPANVGWVTVFMFMFVGMVIYLLAQRLVLP